jgi:hypothetical protein
MALDAFKTKYPRWHLQTPKRDPEFKTDNEPLPNTVVYKEEELEQSPQIELPIQPRAQASLKEKAPEIPIQVKTEKVAPITVELPKPEAKVVTAKDMAMKEEKAMTSSIKLRSREKPKPEPVKQEEPTSMKQRSKIEEVN